MNIKNGQKGQGFYDSKTPNKKTSSLSIEEVKALNTPGYYYPTHLQGRFGRVRSGEWVQWLGLCPFHADTRHGSVSINLHTGAYKCFACGASAGDVLAFHGKRYGLNLKQTLQALGG